MQTQWKGRSKWPNENTGRVCGEPAQEDIVYKEKEDDKSWKKGYGSGIEDSANR